jgi:predicted Rossmann fold nucleotide-binding protein DprA/Smf involved in DNA uptake
LTSAKTIARVGVVGQTLDRHAPLDIQQPYTKGAAVTEAIKRSAAKLITTMRMPRELLKQVGIVAARENRSRTNLCETLIREGLAARKKRGNNVEDFCA